MSSHSDPSAQAPDGSFYNFAFGSGEFAATGPREYYKDIELECSSLLTDETMRKLEVASSDLHDEYAGAGAIRLDESIRRFQAAVGEPLLEELRNGLDYMNMCMSGGDRLPLIYNRDMDSRIFRTRMKNGLGTLSKSYVHSALMLKDNKSAVVTGAADDGRMNVSHYASYLSNVAAWLARGTDMNYGAMHAFSLFLARGGHATASRDFDRINEAMAVLGAEHVRRPDFVETLGRWDGEDAESVPRYARKLHEASWDPRILSIAAPVRRLLGAVVPERMRLADLLPLYIDNRLVLRAESGARADEEVRSTLSPKLLEFDRGRAIDPLRGAVWSSSQTRTDLLPRMAPVIGLDEPTNVGIPALLARTRIGHPAWLVPAEDKCLGFLRRLYSVEIPSPIRPISRNANMLWTCKYDANQLVLMLTQFRMAPLMYGGGRNFPLMPMHPTRIGCTGTFDLAVYMDGVDETDMFVNELTMY